MTSLLPNRRAMGLYGEILDIFSPGVAGWSVADAETAVMHRGRQKLLASLL